MLGIARVFVCVCVGGGGGGQGGRGCSLLFWAVGLERSDDWEYASLFEIVAHLLSIKIFQEPTKRTLENLLS